MRRDLMPILTKGARRIDILDHGAGRATVLLHSSASGAQQWQALSRALPDRRVIAPNLMGYGETSPWQAPPAQTIADQAGLVLAVLDDIDGPVDLVGHSFGALIALEAASMLGGKAGRLVLFEPNPFALLNRPGAEDVWAEVQSLHQHVKAHGARGDWHGAAARFADFFSGPGTWAAMPEARRDALAASLPPNLHEWDAVMDPGLGIARWSAMTAPTLLIWARDSPAPLIALSRILSAANPDWRTEEIPRGGHMAPLTRPRAFNALATAFLAGS
jgi:pimeloyl-ACP methyl ester carboxylesterase